MNISNNDLELLLEIADYLKHNDLSMELCFKLHKLNSKLLLAKIIRNEKARNRVAIRRKNNKMYCRSKSEILQHKNAKKNGKRC